MWHKICERLHLTKKDENFDVFKQEYLEFVIQEVKESNLSNLSKSLIVHSLEYAKKENE